MSDRNDTARPGPRPGQAEDHARKGAEDLRAAAREARDAAGEAAGTVREEVAATTETLKREGGQLLDDARRRAEDMAQEGVRAGADRAGSIARAVHRAADEMERDSPALARTIHEAAGALDGMARRLREQSPGEMLHGAEDFARRQPLAFFGVAALAGFAVARFARSSSPRSSGPAQHGAMRDTMHDMRTAGTGATGPIAGTQGMGAGSPGATPQSGDWPRTAGLPGKPAGDPAAKPPSTLASASLGGAAAVQSPPRDDA
jgi:hypothetical protein